MTWAVRFETEFGRFFPSGSYAEFRERLKNYFFQEMPAEEREVFRAIQTYSRWVFEKFTAEIGALHPRGPTVLTPLLDHEWPREFQAKRRIWRLGSVFQTNNRVLVVNKRFKNVVEKLEPDTHQFRPITIFQPNSRRVWGSYFIMIIGQFRDSFLPDKSKHGLWKPTSYQGAEGNRVETGKFSCHAISKEGFAEIAFSNSAIDGAHLWRERKLLGPNFFMSDALHDAIVKAKLKIPPHFQTKEI